MTKTAGYVLLGAAAAALVVVSGLLAVALASGSLNAGSGAVGFGLTCLVLVVPLAGGGVVVLARGRKEAAEEVESDALRKILDMVKTRGEVDMSDIIIELQSDLPSVQDMIYRLVGMGVFSGYINWDEGKLFSAEASALHELTQCKHCGGQVSFAGKGVVACPFCGTEYFLAQ